MRSLSTEIRFENCVVRVYLHKPTQYSLLHTIRYSLLLLGYEPVQHVTVLNTVGNCNAVVSIIIFHSFIPLACAECEDSLPSSEASSIPLRYVHFSCHPSPPTILPPSLTSSCHLFFGLPLSLAVPSFIPNTLLGILFSSILWHMSITT